MANNVNVTPGHGMAGRHPTRQFLDTLSGHDDPGMFGRMFPTLPPMAVGDAPLKELAEAMKDANPAEPGGDNGKIPAGFTYLGQFVDHDISLDFTSIGEKQADPEATENFRTPALDLNSIYGLGPDGSRQLYARSGGADSGKTPGPKFLIGKTINVPLGDVTGDHRNDLPRSPEGFALIGIIATTKICWSRRRTSRCSSSTTRCATSSPATALLLKRSSVRLGVWSPGIISGWSFTTSSNGLPNPVWWQRSSTKGGSSIASRRCRTCRLRSPVPHIVWATAWCGKPTAIIGSSRSAA